MQRRRIQLVTLLIPPADSDQLMNPSDIPQVDFFKKKGRDFEFEIFSLEELFVRSPGITPRIDQPHRLQFYNILYITHGDGHHHIDFESYPITAGNLIFIARGQVNAFEVRPGIRGYAVLFTPDYLEENLLHSDITSTYRLYNYHLHTPVLSPIETKKENFTLLFQELLREYNEPALFAKNEILPLLLKTLLLKTERVKRSQIPQEKNAQWFIRFGTFRERLEHHFSTTRRVKDYAAMLDLSPKHLNTICRTVSGASAKQCIDSFTILEIKRNLATSDTSIQ